jgi:hypothetical protein
VLQLAAATVVVHVVRAWRIDAIGGGLDDFADFTARIVAATLERSLADSDPVPRNRPWHEDNATIIESPDAIASDRNAGDRHDVAHSA